MKKRLICLGVVVWMMLWMTGCGVDRELYHEMEKLQADAANLQSGMVTLTVEFEEEGFSGEYAAELVFCKTEKETYAYCQKQYDQNEQVTFCEYSDGTVTEQWMIGRGWETVENALFTKETPHRYIAMLSQAHEHGMIQTLEKESDESGTRFILELDPKKAGAHYYKDGNCEVVKQTVRVSFNPEGYVVDYCEETILRNKESGCENRYRAELVCREHNAVTSVEKPALRTRYGSVK